MKLKFVLGLAICISSVISCSSRTELKWHREQGYQWAELSPGYFGSTGFDPLSPSETNIRFKNYASKENITKNRHYLNGSGVAAGDVDGDGRTDLYFAQLDGANKLYKNMGGFRFRDITAEAGVALEEYNSTGVVFADVDGDADPDLLATSITGENVLLINDGAGHFKRKKDSGMGAGKGSTTMALADIDGDGDLDLYVTNYRERTVRDLYSAEELSLDNTLKVEDGVVKVIPPFDQYYGIIQTEGKPYRNEYGEKDELYLNEGDGTFSKVEDLKSRFLSADGASHGLKRDWGLTAKFHDINGDGLSDLYVCNDFWTPDRLWINQGEGIFKASDPLAIRNLSFSSMGVDFSDINRDGFTDLFVTEMLSPVHRRRMRQLADYLEPLNGRSQYNRNSLYLNRGDHTFAEITRFSGLEATEWSWEAKFMDVDLDGYEDLIITTGNMYDYQDLDTQIALNEQIGRVRQEGSILRYPPLKLTNKIYRNNGDLTFSNQSREWGFSEKDVSHGMATADLDHDGDPDLIINRLNEQAILYENTTNAPRIAVRLTGEGPNTQAIGAKIELEGGPATQIKEVVSGGSYLSGSDPLLTFAADVENNNHILTITWPDGTKSRIDSVRADRIYLVDEPADDAGIHTERINVRDRDRTEAGFLFEDISGRIGHIHHENGYNDFSIRPLLPLKLSRQGPGLAWLDVDRDGDDDLLIGTGKGGRIAVFENRGEGRFTPGNFAALNEPAPGDQTAIIGWASGGQTNIVIGSANYEQGNATVPSAFRYTMSKDQSIGKEPVPGILSTTGPLAAADYDGDGDLDLFIGGRFKPGAYPADASSRLLKNEKGHFQMDAVNSRKLFEIGLATGAVFSDYDRDGDPDLLLSRAWDTLVLLENNGGIYRDISGQVGLAQYKGWWNGIATGDFNNDGRPDIIATNIGLNSVWQMESGHPLKIFYDDFNSDGRLDILEAYYNEAAASYMPRRRLYEFDSMPMVLSNVQSHREFAESTVEEIFRKDFSRVPSKEINTLHHMLFLNNGESYSAHPLPAEAQWSAAFYAGVADVDNDGNEDIFLSQNIFAFPPHIPRLDAGRGLWLKGDGNGNLMAVSGNKTGIKVYGQQRGAALSDFNGDGKVDLAVSQNGSATKLYINRGNKRGLRVRLAGPPANRDGIGSSIRLVYEDGRKGPRREIQAGSGYWSQNSATQVMGTAANPAGIEVVWFDGTVQTIDVVQGKENYVIDY